jgi:hypothetical protein
MATCSSSSKNTGKMSLIPVFNKNSPRAHTELELDVLGVHGKLVKYEVYLFKRKKMIFFSFFLHTSCPNNNLTNFWSQGILGVKEYHEFNSLEVNILFKVDIL